MYFVDLLDTYLFKPPYSKDSFKYIEVSYFYSILFFSLSLLSRALGYSILSNLDFYSFLILFLENLFVLIISIFLFVVWVSFFVAVSKKIMVLKNYLFIILSSFSPCILLLPISIILYYFNLKSLFAFIDFIISCYIFFRIINKTKLYFNFNSGHIFLIIFLPFLFLLLSVAVAAIVILFLIYGKV